MVVTNSKTEEMLIHKAKKFLFWKKINILKLYAEINMGKF